MSCAERVPRARRFPLEARAARTPDAPALLWRRPPAPAGASHGDLRALTFGELEARTGAIARALLARGVARGERVGLRLPQEDESYPTLLLALLRAGCVAAPVSTRLPAEAVPGLLQRAGCRRLITADGGAAAPPGGLGAIAAGELLAAPGADSAAALPFDPAAPATLVFTSGSAGEPKAALHSFANHWASAVGANRNIPLRRGDRWLLSLPLWHVGGLAVLFRCLQAGAAVVLPARGETLAEAVETCDVTHVSLVATQLYRLLQDKRGRVALRRLHAALLGGGPLPAPLLAEAVALGARLVTSYGSTETCSQASATRPGDHPEALRTAGRALPFREIAVAAGGEILVRGRTLFLGYADGAGLRDARDAAGWFHSGDLGRFDAAGRLVVEGRRDAMFVSGGENVHPEEIERALVNFPGILDALVVPVPDPEFGSRPAAFLRTAGGPPPDPADLDAFLRRTLPGFKVPGRFFPWPDLGEGVKPSRRALASLAAAAGESPERLGSGGGGPR